jgi:hypothetical protein
MTAAPRSTVSAAGTARAPEGRCTPRARSPAHAAAGPVALICFRQCDISPLTFWRDRAEAEEALHSLLPCDSGCANSHALVFVDAGRIRTEPYPARPVLLAPVIPGSWRASTSRRRVDCPFCGDQHSHPHRHIDSVRPSGCLQGFYRITNGDNENDNDILKETT